ITQATHDGVWEWRRETGQAWWNRQQYELLGYDPAATAPSFEAWARRIHPDDHERVTRQLRETLANGSTMWQCEYRFLHGERGSVGVALDRGYVERDERGQVSRIVGATTDITTERAATAALKASEERFREMTSAIEHLFWLANPEGTEALYVSPAYEKIWGRTCESVYERAESFVEAIHEDDRERVMARLPLQREGTYDETYRIRRPDGTIVWIRSRAFPIRDAHGNVVRVAGIAMDITAQRQLEQQLAQAQRLESIGRLAGGIAHDFNNLLTIILGSVDMMMLGAHVDTSLHADLVAVKEAGERAATLTSQLLLFARRQAVAPARLDVADVARQTERMLRRTIGEHVEVTTWLDPQPCDVVADRAQLEQVLVNLVLNARDAMPNGGRLSIEVRNVRVGVSGDAIRAEPRTPVGPPSSERAFQRAGLEPGDYVLLAVSDTGVGISNDALPHVFEPFFTTKPAGKGTGLGLATCYGIVQAAGGVILVDTKVGTGSSFTVLLPRATGERATPASQRPSASISGGTETVLFVEDDPGVRRIGVHILKAHNYRVLTAAAGSEALELAASHPGPIHLLLTDVVMPGMSGTQLAGKLRTRRPELRILYSSGYTEDSAMHHSLQEPRTAFLRKPYVRETLLEKVRELLDAAD
ncbi:MAG TPA: PAS domain-containing protein, partial [Polyangiaceae bacterium]|nr:PAS domain-containing protein [Polyangiaceae bacterium]